MDLKQLYNDVKFPASFSGKKRFTAAVQSRHPTVKAKDVEKVLLATDNYTLHKPTRKTQIYRRVYTKRIGYLYQIDLVDMTKFADKNDGYKWLITCIDTFSKKAWSFKMKNKTADSIMKVMKPFLLVNRPQKLEFDQVNV